MKVKDIVREDNKMYKVIKNDPTTGIDLQHPDDPHSTLHLDPEAAKAITANPDNPSQFTMNPAVAGAMGTDAPQGPQQGAEIEMPATEDYELEQDMMQKGRRNRKIGGDATDSYIMGGKGHGVVDHDFERAAHEDFLGFGNKSPEEWAKTSKQMAELLKLQKAYQGTQYQSQIEKRIALLKDRLDMDAGEVGGAGGIPKPVVPPEKFKQFNEEEKLLGADNTPQYGNEHLDIMAKGVADGIKSLPPEKQAAAEQFIVRDADGNVDGDETMYKMMQEFADMGPKIYQMMLDIITYCEGVINSPDFAKYVPDPAQQQTVIKDVADMRAQLPGMKANVDKANALAATEMPKLRQAVDQRANTAFKAKTGTDMVRTATGAKTNIGTDPNAGSAPQFESADDKLLQQMLSIAGLK